MVLDDLIDRSGLGKFFSSEQRGKSFFVEVVKHDLMADALQIVPDRMGDGMIQAVGVRVPKNKKDFHYFFSLNGVRMFTIP